MISRQQFQRAAIAGLGCLMLISDHASAQEPLDVVPGPPQWRADSASVSMGLAPTWAKLAIGLPAARTALHVLGGDVTSKPGTGSVTVGPTDSLHMQIDNNDLRVSGSLPGTFGSLYFQRYGGPIVVHGSRPLEDRVYITNDGDLGVGTADPQQFAIDRDLVSDEHWTVANGHYEMPSVAIDGYAFATQIRAEFIATKRIIIGSALKDNGMPFAQDTVHSDSILKVGGKVAAQSIVVHLDGWADDVFDDGYPLMPLDELESFIKREKHLPGVPSESEALSTGLDVAKSNEALLRKVEELTLHTIAQQKQIEELERKIDDLANQ